MKLETNNNPIMIGFSMANKKSKRFPVQKHCELGGIAGSADWYKIDVARHLSELNHRLYRQSRVYRVKINHMGNPTDRGQLDVYVLRDTWMLQKAYQMAMDTYYDNMKEEAKDISKTNMARWQDFRIVLDPKASGVTEKLPLKRANGTLNTTTMSNGEFENTLVYKEDGTAMSFGLYPTVSRWSIVEEYDKTADVDNTPSNGVSGSDINPYGALDDDNQQAARNDLQVKGNSPPYDPNSLDGDSLLRRVASVGSTGGAQRLSTGFFDAPLGLVIVVATNTDVGTDFYELEVQGGDYKGVNAPTFVEAKSMRKGSK